MTLKQKIYKYLFSIIAILNLWTPISAQEIINVTNIPEFYPGSGSVLHRDIHVALNAFDETPGKLAAFGKALKNDESLVIFFSTGSKSQIELYLKGWSELFDAGRLNAASSKICMQNYSSLNTIARSKVIQFSDNSSNSTIVEFLSGLDAEKIVILNKYEGIAEGIIGHKVGYTAAQYEDLAEVVNDMEKLTYRWKHGFYSIF